MGKKWIKTLRERLMVHLKHPMLPEGEPERQVADDFANSLLANRWKAKMQERLSAKAKLVEARKRLRTTWAEVSVQTDAPSYTRSTSMF